MTEKGYVADIAKCVNLNWQKLRMCFGEEDINCEMCLKNSEIN